MSHLNAAITPFTIYKDVDDGYGNSFRKGTVFSYIGGTSIKASLSVRSLTNMFETTEKIIDTKKDYWVEPFEYMNIIKALSAGLPVPVAASGSVLQMNGAVVKDHITNTEVFIGTQQITDLPTALPKIPPEQAPAKKRAADQAKQKPKPLAFETFNIKKVYCPYNGDLIVYDEKNNRVNDLCGELTPKKFYQIMLLITKTTVFEGFDYFKELCFDQELIPRTKELENDDFAALELMKDPTARGQKLIDMHGYSWRKMNGRWEKI